MDWNLVVAVLALIISLGGIITFIFTVGSWKSSIDSKLEVFEKDINSINETLNGGSSLSGVISKVVTTHINVVRTELNVPIIRAHERLDNLLADDLHHKEEKQKVEHRVETIVAGLQGQRQDWDLLRSDVRALLRSEATTTNEIANFKERLSTFEHKIATSSENIVRLQSDVAHITFDRKK